MRGAAILVGAVGALVLFLIAEFVLSRDPFDRFEVIGVAKDAASGRVAVTYKHHHSDSSNDVCAVYLLSEMPPIGSTNPPPGRSPPILVWNACSDISGVTWSAGKLIATAINPKTPHDATGSRSCYFEYESRLICSDATKLPDLEIRRR